MTASTEAPAATSPPSEFVRGIGPLAAVSLVVGSMIGSGIFIVSADIARQMSPWGPGGLLLVWLITGIVTVIGGTALALSMTSAPIATDLETRSVAALSAGHADWAAVRIDGRDAIVAGTATTQQMIDDAIGRVAEVPGIRAASVVDHESARLSREHNDANVLALGERLTPVATARDLVATFLDTPFGGGRHQRRVDKINALDRRPPA
jgi:hypothetical protein